MALLPALSGAIRPDGGVVTQRIANPCTPVRFRLGPPYFQMLCPKLVSLRGEGHAGWIWAALAQVVEHIIRNDGARGSSPLSGTTTLLRKALHTKRKGRSAGSALWV